MRFLEKYLFLGPQKPKKRELENVWMFIPSIAFKQPNMFRKIYYQKYIVSHGKLHWKSTYILENNSTKSFSICTAKNDSSNVDEICITTGCRVLKDLVNNHSTWMFINFFNKIVQMILITTFGGLGFKFDVYILYKAKNAIFPILMQLKIKRRHAVRIPLSP